eukprot:TRINITY_DN16815_c0_g1_i1.p1 TRINITY_DN16815_c0_g1~~TRINITY_DN16815_c0_g1_i1.p1  ORF type:complete len:1519 (-),score=314.14 TRINITY_DN16815_c0_g1_i1:179-4546(-)
MPTTPVPKASATPTTPVPKASATPTTPVPKASVAPPAPGPKASVTPPAPGPKASVTPPVPGPKAGAGSPSVSQPGAKAGAGSPTVTQPGAKAGAGPPSVTQPGAKAGAGSPVVSPPGSKAGAGSPVVSPPGSKAGAGSPVVSPPGSKASPAAPNQASKTDKSDAKLLETVRVMLQAAAGSKGQGQLETMLNQSANDKKQLGKDELWMAFRKVLKINKEKLTDKEIDRYFTLMDNRKTGQVSVKTLVAFGFGEDVEEEQEDDDDEVEEEEEEAQEEDETLEPEDEDGEEEEAEVDTEVELTPETPRSESRKVRVVSHKVKELDPELADTVKHRIKAACVGLGGRKPKARMKKLFEKIDKDTSGDLTREEFRDAVRRVFKIGTNTLPEHKMDNLFDVVDFDRTGVVSAENLFSWADSETPVTTPRSGKRPRTPLDEVIYKMRSRVKEITNGRESELTKLLKSVSAGGGELEINELRNLLRKKLKIPASEVTDTQVTQLFAVLDTDDDGTVSPTEITNFMADLESEEEDAINARRQRKDLLELNMRRLHELYKHFEQKQERIRLRRKMQEENDRRTIEEAKRKAFGKNSRGSRRFNGKLGSRMYQAFFKNEEKMYAMRQQMEEDKKKELEQEMAKNRPTRSRSSPTGNASEAGRRLYFDAERRERDRQLAKDASDMALQEELSTWTSRRRENSIGGASSVGSVLRHEDLYAEATRRRQRQDERRHQSEAKERKDLEDQMVFAAKGKEPNVERLQELHLEYAERQRRIAVQVAEKHSRETEAIQAIRAQFTPRSASGGRPSTSQDIRSPRFVRAENREALLKASRDAEVAKKKEEDKQAARKSVKPLSTQADHTLASVVMAVAGRSAYGTGTDSMWDAAHRPLVAPLQAAMKVYQEALKNCESNDGFAALAARSSQRLFNERLLPEHEGWAKNIEPNPIRQVEDRMEDLLVSAKHAQVALRESIAGGPQWTSGSVRAHPAGVPIALFAYDPGVKSEVAARAKATCRYGPGEGPNRYRHVLDYARMLLVFSSCDMLQAGLDQILRRFEVVDVRNYFNTPGRLGVRFVEVLVIVKIGESNSEPKFMLPHVCELRLEELCFHKAQEMAAPHMDKFFAGVRSVYARHGRDQDSLLHLVHTVLSKPAPSHDLRVFRCHMAKRNGSSIAAWRRNLGGGRLFSFPRFRELCQSLNCGEHTTEYWQSLDPTLGGCISMFDLDPEAVSLLIKFRARMLALADVSSDKEADPESLFARFSFLVRPRRSGRLERQEFRQVAIPIGLSKEEADKVFSYLDYHAGISHPAAITVMDIAWLNKLPQLIDIDAVILSSATDLRDDEALRGVSWSGQSARRNKRGEILRWSVYEDDIANVSLGGTPSSSRPNSAGRTRRRSDIGARSQILRRHSAVSLGDADETWAGGHEIIDPSDRDELEGAPLSSADRSSLLERTGMPEDHEEEDHEDEDPTF